MSASTVAPVNYLNKEHLISSWLLTRDHKRIALLFFASITFFFFVGGAAATLIRLQLINPAGGLLQPDIYNRLFTMHGVVMVWFFLIPSIPATLGNFLLPLMIGAHDLAFPRLNLGSWYLFNISGLFAIYFLFVGGVDTGWTFYTPYSTLFANSHVIAAAVAVFINGFSTIATALNFVVSTHKLRAPGMTWFRLPLFVWAIYVTSVIMLLATPVLAMTLVLVALERLMGIGIFDPALGGDPILFQHMFWFYSHPAVYIMVLPAMGVVSEVISCFARRPVFGYKGMCYALLTIGVLGFFVWGHHMFVAGISLMSAVVFSLMTFFVAVPSAIKVFNWTVTLYDARISFDAPMLYALGFVGLFTIGGLTGLMVATLAADVHLRDTYFVVAHFHFIMVGGTVSAYFAGLHYWWPKIIGRQYPEMWARFAAILMFVGFNVTFLPQFVLGYLGMVRRWYTYPPELQTWNVLSSAGASILAVAYALPLFYLTWSMIWGGRATANPWRATGLEWRTTSPPIPDNFARTPIVTEPPYQYNPIDGSSVAQDGTRAMASILAPEPQYADMEHQAETAQFGMWVFIATEILFFGALILGYSVYRRLYPAQFNLAGHDSFMLNGSLNQAILITSSLTMVLAVRAARMNRQRALVLLLVATAALGVAFLGVKGWEYARDIHAGSLPVLHFDFKPGYGPPVEMFWTFYWIATGLHAVHLSIGIALLFILTLRAARGDFSRYYNTPLEVIGLYWSFVDTVWFFLFACIYPLGACLVSGQAPEPILPYFIGWGVLLLLLGLSVWSAYLDIGSWHPFVNFGIAFTQTGIIFILFMRLRSQPRLTWLIAGSGFFWLMFLDALTAVDYATRSGLSN